MISSNLLAQDIVLDLDQNAYTSWYDKTKILNAINSACEFIQIYAKRPWTLTLESIESDDPKWSDLFTCANEIIYPYWAELDWVKFDRTNIPLIWRDRELWDSFYVSWNVVKTSEPWKKLDILYHRGFQRLSTLWNDDIDMPQAMHQTLLHTALWFVYPSGLDIWASLSNQHYNMMMTLLSTYWKAYGFDIQPVAAKAVSIYNK